MQTDPIMTSGIGSLPRPKWLAGTDRGQANFLFSETLLKEAQDDATRLALLDQERIGIDVLTDGEIRRTNFIFDIAGRWTGIDAETLALKEIFRNQVRNRQVPRVVGEVKHRPSGQVAALQFAKAHTTKPIKVAVPGPMTIVDSTVDEFYGSEEALAFDAARALNQELRDLQAAGCDMLQIDEPAMTRYHTKVKDYGAKALDRCLDGIDVPVLVHLCYGYPGGATLQYQYEYGDLIPMLMDTRIGGFTVEFGRSSFDPSVLKACGDRFVLFGCVDPGDSPAPTVDAVRRRVGRALEYVDPTKLLISPDCGLMTIGRPLAVQKLGVLVDVSHAIRRTL